MSNPIEACTTPAQAPHGVDVVVTALRSRSAQVRQAYQRSRKTRTAIAASPMRGDHERQLWTFEPTEKPAELKRMRAATDAERKEKGAGLKSPHPVLKGSPPRIRNGSRTGTDKRSRRSRPALVRRSNLEVGRKCRRKSWCRRCCRNCCDSRCCTFPI